MSENQINDLQKNVNNLTSNMNNLTKQVNALTQKIKDGVANGTTNGNVTTMEPSTTEGVILQIAKDSTEANKAIMQGAIKNMVIMFGMMILFLLLSALLQALGISVFS